MKSSKLGLLLGMLSLFTANHVIVTKGLALMCVIVVIASSVNQGPATSTFFSTAHFSEIGSM